MNLNNLKYINVDTNNVIVGSILEAINEAGVSDRYEYVGYHVTSNNGMKHLINFEGEPLAVIKETDIRKEESEIMSDDPLDARTEALMRFGTMLESVCEESGFGGIVDQGLLTFHGTDANGDLVFAYEGHPYIVMLDDG